ncbi:D-2-hydroxyacid dehydrogenase [Virgibacillus sp. C22-A2]|uniref:D-2-hydroxyacid dehydrogenase n=1 Tax=Virgibacillus tibetensis TaxID=3042313 RepID=A0ABU6KFR7_9BACI|nr:D-2-hydroxyacid dehydrogenase [Virgibacillus sp. C22-A2]
MIITNIEDLSSDQLHKISQFCGREVQFIADLTDNEACNFADVEILITYGKQVDKQFFEKCTNLKWIQVFQSGVERIPFKELEKRGILLTNIVGIHGIPMSEFVISTILYFTRDFPKYLANKENKVWDRTELVGEAYNKTVGIIGAGTIGQEIAEKLHLLGMKVYGLNTAGVPKPYFEKMFSKDQKMDLLGQCDFVILLLPLTEQTRDYIREAELKKMKKDSYLINIGRGPLINEKAFISAIQNKEIKGAALDVFHEEPLPKDSKLWELENVLITPHVAAKSVHFLDRCIEKFQIEFDRYSKNQPLHNQIDLVRTY